MDSERSRTECQPRGRQSKPPEPGIAARARPSHLAWLCAHPLTCLLLSLSADLCAHSRLDVVLGHSGGFPPNWDDVRD